MLRTALKLLLAVVLCLNGFLTPVAMAAQMPVAAAQSEAVAPCHGDAAADAATPAGQTRQATGETPSHPDCCKRGHCLCAALFSLQVPETALPALAPQTQLRTGPGSVHYASLGSAVPLRPPIA